MLLNRCKPPQSNAIKHFSKRLVSYVQGQEPEPNLREYFYFIDHQGMLFLDDARMKNFTSCFKEKKFLRFFFNQLRWNNTERYREFPYLSICQGERNYIRCDDLPFVFSHVFVKTGRDGSKEEHLAHNNAGEDLSLKFEPEKIVMLPDTGRVYHPAPLRAGSIGLIKSKLAIEFSKHFSFDNGESNPPTQFDFNGKRYHLDTEWFVSALKNKPGG